MKDTFGISTCVKMSIAHGYHLAGICQPNLGSTTVNDAKDRRGDHIEN